MFGALGGASHVAVRDVRVAGVAANAGRCRQGCAASLLPVRNTRRIGKRDMVLNDALPNIEIDPERYTVTIDGERIVADGRPPSLPLAQRYFLF